MRGATKAKLGVLVVAVGALAADRLLLGGGFGPAAALAEQLALGEDESVDVQALLGELASVQALANNSAGGPTADGAIPDAFAASDRLLALLAQPEPERGAAMHDGYSVAFAGVMLGRDPIATIDNEQRRVGDQLDNGLVIVRIEESRVVLSNGTSLFSVLLGTDVAEPIE